jgi:hypothetical protein
MSRSSSLVRMGCAVTLGFLAASVTSRASGDQLLAGYEPSDVGCLVVAPAPSDSGLTVTWPVRGGVDGVPAATEGQHVLKMEWANETDRKVAIRHDWPCSTFDLPGLLAGVVEIQVDVYVATPSATPQIEGIWDDVLGWIKGCPLPVNTNEWITVSMYVGHMKHFGLDHIAAILFENLGGEDGVIYIDNLRLISPRRITFAGYDWVVKSGNCINSGPNDFSSSKLPPPARRGLWDGL